MIDKTVIGKFELCFTPIRDKPITATNAAVIRISGWRKFTFFQATFRFTE